MGSAARQDVLEGDIACLQGALVGHPRAFILIYKVGVCGQDPVLVRTVHCSPRYPE